MSKYGKYGVGGPAPKIGSLGGVNESPCDIGAASQGTTNGVPDTKPEVSPTHP